MNPWIAYCKKWAKDHKCSYMQAIKDAKSSYHAKKKK